MLAYTWMMHFYSLNMAARIAMPAGTTGVDVRLMGNPAATTTDRYLHRSQNVANRKLRGRMFG